jgi:hypothetical protein
VDVRDAFAVGSILEAARAEIGPIRGVIHGAGVLGRPQDRGPDRRAVRDGLRHQGRRPAGRARRPGTGRAEGPRPVLLLDGAVRPVRPGRVRGGQRGPEQEGPARGRSPPVVPGRLGELGSVGRRHGHAGAEAPVRTPRGSR